MHVGWLKGCSSKEEKDQRIAQVKGYKRAFEDLAETLTEVFEKKAAVRDYSPGWESKQISVNEYNQALSDIINFITLKD